MAMETAHLGLIAGSLSSLLFVTSVFPMLLKVYQSHDMHSYTLGNIVLNNVANVVHWLYILSLPVGPIWLLHSFYTVTTLLLLVAYLYYGR